jgi:hypothetical protein
MPSVGSKAVFVIAPPTDWVVTVAMAAMVTLDYLAVRVLIGSGGVVHFAGLAATTLLALSAALRTRVVVAGDDVLVRRYGYLGPIARYSLSEISAVRSGFVSGEAVIEITRNSRVVRLGPWFGLNRRRLVRKVDALVSELVRRSEVS